MAKPLIDDELWALIEPLIPVKKRRFRHPGRKPLPPRQVLTGIVFVLTTGIPWEYLPQEMGCGSGMTCWRRLEAWHKAGVWQKVLEVLLAKLRQAECLDLSRVPVDASSVRAVGAGEKKPAPTPPIAPSPAPSTTSSPTPRACPWPSRRRGPTKTTSRSCSRCWRASRPSGAKREGPSASPEPSWATGPTVPNPTGKNCAGGGLSPSWPSAGRPTAAGWARCAGWWSAPSVGCTASGACASATNAAPTSTRPCSKSAAYSSAGVIIMAHFVRRS
jgi:transposase